MDIRSLPEKERNLYNGLKKKFSLHFESLQVGKHRLRLLRLSDIEEILQGADPFDDIGSFPFWARLWESSIVLGHILAGAPEREGGRLLELGAGLGVAGLSAAAAGFRVVMTDPVELPLDFQRVSAAASGIRGVEHALLDITQKPQGLETFDVIAAAELLFREEHIEPMLDVCLNCLSESGSIYLAHDARRKSLGLFLKKADNHFRIGTRKQTVKRNNTVYDILVNRLQRK